MPMSKLQKKMVRDYVHELLGQEKSSGVVRKPEPVVPRLLSELGYEAPVGIYDYEEARDRVKFGITDILDSWYADLTAVQGKIDEAVSRKTLCIVVLGLLVLNFMIGTVAYSNSTHLRQAETEIAEMKAAKSGASIPLMPPDSTSATVETQSSESAGTGTWHEWGDASASGRTQVLGTLVIENEGAACWMRVTAISGFDGAVLNTNQVLLEDPSFVGYRSFSSAKVGVVEIRSGCPGRLHYSVDQVPQHPDNLSQKPEQSEVVHISF